MALPIFAATLFLSAFLLFLVQPMIGKMILPKLGGTPQVWNTCMMFFQCALLAGYGYTHSANTWFKTRQQIILHAFLLLLPFGILLLVGPFKITDWVPPAGVNPIFATLGILSVVVGIPFIVVATSAPLLQKWFANTGHPAAKDPYFLYGASNLGSMLALACYPFLVEPYLTIHGQAVMWWIGYSILVVTILVCGIMAFNELPTVKLAGVGGREQPVGPEPPPPMVPEATEGVPLTDPQPETAITSAPAAAPSVARTTAIKKGGKQKKGKHKDFSRQTAAIGEAASAPVSVARPSAPRPDQEEVTVLRRIRWVCLAAVSTSLMLGVTTYMSTDIAAIPMFWVLTLGLYLLSFILVFARWPVVWTEEPHKVAVYLQPVCLALLILALQIHGNVNFNIALMVVTFFVTALVCHGELAKDRPSTRHLTEFFLLMSVGGALGGTFNALVAPIVFQKGVAEFPIALVLAGLVRPLLKEGGWIDQLFAGQGGAPVETGRGRQIRRSVAQGVNPGLSYSLDVALPGVIFVVLLIAVLVIRPRTQLNTFIVYGIPLAIACFYYARPLRFGLAIGAVLLVPLVDSTLHGESDGIVLKQRSYFGVLRVQQSAERPVGSDYSFPYYTLMHGTTNHGMALIRPDDPKKPDYSRLATTYYHRDGPAGIVMEKFNWFPDKGDGKFKNKDGSARINRNNSFDADARLPASLVALGASNLSSAILPQLVSTWSEPAYATIGLGTGTMASYARPYQTVHFYEIDELIRRMSLPNGDVEEPPHFKYLFRARNDRKANVSILMGDARLRMNEPWIPKGMEDKQPWEIDLQDRGGGEHFYHAIIVDAFSSDAIPVHLLTKEAMAMYFEKLAPHGILCVHTSNRHLRLVPVVTDVASKVEWLDWETKDTSGVPTVKKTGLVCKVGHDSAPGHELGLEADIGHFTSEWVMVARSKEDLDKLQTPADYKDKARELARKQNRVIDSEYWHFKTPTGRHVWTDDFSNVPAVYRWPWSSGGD